MLFKAWALAVALQVTLFARGRDVAQTPGIVRSKLERASGVDAAGEMRYPLWRPVPGGEWAVSGSFTVQQALERMN